MELTFFQKLICVAFSPITVPLIAADRLWYSITGHYLFWDLEEKSGKESAAQYLNRAFAAPENRGQS